METLIKIQTELKVPKANLNAFGKYKYRSAEDILEAVKPILKSNKALLTISDDIVLIGNKSFLKATATLMIGNSFTINICGFAELCEHKGMSAEQATGTASSYARKYALNGLFLIDETEQDPDSKDSEKKQVDKRDSVKEQEKPYLNENSDQFTEAAKYLKSGGTFENIRKKYNVSKAVEDLLIGSILA